MRLGADPEVFLAFGKRVVSAIDRVGGTKQSPKQIPTLKAGYTVQEDNVAMEFGIPPCDSESQFIGAIRNIREHGLSMVKVMKDDPLDKPLQFAKMSCTVFPAKELQHPGALVFGCEPDFNAWTGKPNPQPIIPKPGLRSAGGHIHMETKQDKLAIIRACDLTVGLATLFLDKSNLRRKLYGKAGAFRPKEYGVEYRVPSNFWIFKDLYVRSMWRRMMEAKNFVDDGVNLELIGKRIQYAINYEDKNMAESLLNKYNISMGMFE